jgi:hypothetical protein
MAAAGNTKINLDLMQIKIKKLVKVDRNPPSPYSTERVCFRLD